MSELMNMNEVTETTAAVTEKVGEQIIEKTNGRGITGRDVGVAAGGIAVGIGLWEGGKWLVRKIKSKIANKKVKKQENCKDCENAKDAKAEEPEGVK